MFDSSLATTNLFLGIMATVSVLEALLLVAIAVAAWKVYGRSLEAIAEARQQVAPLVTRVNALADKVDKIAADVQDVTSTVASATARAETALGIAADVVAGGLGMAGASVARRTLHLYGIARGIRAAYRSFVRHDASGGHKEG